MASRLALGLALGVIMLAFFAVVQGRKLDALRQEAALWKSSAQSQQQVLQETQQARQATEAALVERQAQIDKVSKERARLQKILREAQRHDQTLVDWARTALPDAVRGVLEEGSHARAHP